jgi:hypothetical protein
MDTWVEEMVDISRDESRDLQPDGKGGMRSDNTAVNRDRLKCDNIKFIASRIHAKKYGDKITQEVTGANGADLVPVLNINITKKDG